MADGRDTPDLPRGLIDRRGTPLGKGTRLPSIRGPRDLTLGGIPKKVFTPKIPVRKTEPKEQKPVTEDVGKNSTEEVKTDVKELKRTSSKSKPQDNTQKKYKGKNIIHTHSIFEDQGSSKNITKVTARDTESVGGKFGSRSTSSAATKKSIKSEEKDDSKEVLDYLLRDDFIDGTKKKIQFMEPVHLPLSQIHIQERNSEIKEDPDGDTEMSEPSDEKPYQDTVLEAITKSDSSDELLFFQFPDCLPGMPTARLNSDDNDVQEEDKPSTQMLTDFSEGSVGKLVVRKSGKTQLVIGNVTMDVSMGTKCNFLQDVVSIHTSENSGSLSVLGHVQHRLVCTPDFDSMLHT